MLRSGVITRLKARQEWIFFCSLTRAAPPLATMWWVLLVVRGLLPALLAISTGVLVGAVQRGASLTGPLTFLGFVFIAFQVLTPLHLAVSTNLGSRMAAWLHDSLMDSCIAPEGIAHLEDPALVEDLTMARDFDLGIMGPPLTISMDFIAGGLVELLGGVFAALILFGFGWWQPPLLLVAWVSTHWLLRESGVWKDRNTEEVRNAQRHADYAYRLAVDPPAAKELRLFGLAGWVVDRFALHRRKLYELQYEATRLRERPLIWCLAIVTAANVLVLWTIAQSAADGHLSLGSLITYAQAAFATSAIAFGGLSWALDGAAAPVAAVRRLRASMAKVGTLESGQTPATSMPARDIRFRDVTFTYPRSDRPVLEHFDLTIPAGTSLAIVGQNGAGKTTLAKLLCRLYDPQSGAIEVDGVDLRELDIRSWRSRLAAVFQDFVRFELPLRSNVAPGGAPDDVISASLVEAGAEAFGTLGTILARAYRGGTDLSGGQWQRVALARALSAVKLGAGLVLLDEPTAQLDVRGEAEVFERILKATRNCTTILISHRFSTVRHADRICVVEHGRVVELGTHDELIALGGRYRTMFDLQAARFVELDDEGMEVVYDRL